jgi:hypothetical protein
MTSSSRRSSWTTRQPKHRPPCSTLRPQVEGALRSSCCFHAHHNRNRRVLRRPLPLLPPTTVAKARARGKKKARTTAPTAPATTSGAPQCSPPSTIPGPAPCRCGQGCILHSSRRRIYHSTPCSLHRRTMGPPAVPPLHPSRRLHRTSSRSQPLLGRLGRVHGINNH